MFQLIRIVLWISAAVVALVYAYTGTLTYRLDEQNLSVQTNEWLGRLVSRQEIPVSSISSIEYHARSGSWKIPRNPSRMDVVGVDGGILRSDELGEPTTATLAEGLKNALRKRPVETYAFSCGHTNFKGLFFAIGFFILALTEWADRRQERKLRPALGKS